MPAIPSASRRRSQQLASQTATSRNHSTSFPSRSPSREPSTAALCAEGPRPGSRCRPHPLPQRRRARRKTSPTAQSSPARHRTLPSTACAARTERPRHAGEEPSPPMHILPLASRSACSRPRGWLMHSSHAGPVSLHAAGQGLREAGARARSPRPPRAPVALAGPLAARPQPQCRPERQSSRWLGRTFSGCGLTAFVPGRCAPSPRLSPTTLRCKSVASRTGRAARCGTGRLAELQEIFLGAVHERPDHAQAAVVCRELRAASPRAHRPRGGSAGGSWRMSSRS